MTQIYTKIDGYEVLEDKSGIVIKVTNVIPWFATPTEDELAALVKDYETAKGLWVDTDSGCAGSSERLGIVEIYGGVSQRQAEILDKVLTEVTI